MSMKFSIIIPTYNNSEYLKVCLHSLLLQDFPKSEYEIIVVDDASTENIEKVSSEVLSGYIAYNPCCTSHILKLFRHDENKRQGGARNTGLKYAGGGLCFLFRFGRLLVCDEYFEYFRCSFACAGR